MSDRTYLAGPMRGLPRYNFDTFHAAATDLRQRGWEVMSPAEMDEAEGFDADRDEATPEFMQAAYRRDIAVLIDPATTAIHMLAGWQDSGGARLEHDIARRVGLTVYTFDYGMKGPAMDNEWRIAWHVESCPP